MNKLVNRHGEGFTCSFSVQELSRFLQFIKRSQGPDITIKRSATVAGKQAEGYTWILNSDLYINSNGEKVELSLPTFYLVTGVPRFQGG